MLTVFIDGEKNTVVDSPDELPVLAAEFGIDVARIEIPADELAAYEAYKKRMKIRSEIEPVAGDTLSLLGTTSDATGLLLELVLTLAGAMATSNEINLANAGSAVFTDLSAIKLGLDDGSIKLPHMIKTKAAVVADIAARSTAVVEVFENNAP